MKMYIVHGNRKRNDEQRRFKAPVFASSSTDARRKFLEQVKRASEFRVSDVIPE